MRIVKVYVVEENDKDIIEKLKEHEPEITSVEMDTEGEIIGYFITDTEFCEELGITDGEIYVPYHLLPYKVMF